jgi:hypothetical protein
MHFLVVSKGFMAGKEPSKKMPGIALAEELERLDVFKLLDLPSNFNGHSLVESLKIILAATKSIIKKVIENKNDEFFFYNFPKAYIYFYFLIKIFGGRTSLFMADGENCVGLKKFPRLFIKFFEKIVHLHYAEKDHYKKLGKPAYWFPGIINRGAIDNFKITSADPATILYNSSLKASNNPDLLIEIASLNPNIQFYCTSNIKSFYDCGFISSARVIQNINFIGELSKEDYKNLLQEIDGILLIRDENRFENMYNFPSKLIEALCHEKTVFSIFEISGVPLNLYVNCKNTFELKKTAFNIYLHSSECTDFSRFIEACDVQNIVAWLNLTETRNSNIDRSLL